MSGHDEFESIIGGQGFDLTVRGAALDIDADWFATNPGQRVVLRRLIPGEFGDDVAERLDPDQPYMVVVIRDTVRVLIQPLLFEVIDGDDEDER